MGLNNMGIGLFDFDNVTAAESIVTHTTEHFRPKLALYFNETDNRQVKISISNGTDAEGNGPSFPAKITVLVILALIVLTGIVGNILVLVVIAAVKSMHTTVNKCLFSLGVADTMVLVFLPIVPVAEIFTNDMSFLGRNFCMFLNFYDRGAVVCSVLIFLYMTMDRYVALCHPLNPRRFGSGKKIYGILLGIWVIASATSVPYLFMSDFLPRQQGNETVYDCIIIQYEPWQIWYDTAGFVLSRIVPVPFLLALYGRMVFKISRKIESADANNTRGRHQVVFMLLMVVTLFIMCQFPVMIITFLEYHWPSVFTFANNSVIFAIVWTCRLLLYFNSAINPVLYFSMSSKFRGALKDVLSSCRKQAQPLTPSTGVSNVTLNTNL